MSKKKIELSLTFQLLYDTKLFIGEADTEQEKRIVRPDWRPHHYYQLVDDDLIFLMGENDARIFPNDVLVGQGELSWMPLDEEKVPKSGDLYAVALVNNFHHAGGGTY